jgi:GDP-mannose pyrophosphatase NudK
MTKNKRVKIDSIDVLSDNWYILKKVNFKYQLDNGTWQEQSREVYDRGNGATILLYNTKKKTVILTNQFRMPTYLNGNESGMLVEACAGLLDNDNAEECIRRETEEETGYQVSNVRKIFETYMSPGSVTEILHFFVAEYTDDMKTSEGGGLKDDQENIDVLELPFERACEMIGTGEIKDAKTIMLLQYMKINDLIMPVNTPFYG